jgi:hypothetical protein
VAVGRGWECRKQVQGYYSSIKIVVQHFKFEASSSRNNTLPWPGKAAIRSSMVSLGTSLPQHPNLCLQSLIRC